MRVIVQIAKDAKCVVDNQITGAIDFGYMLLVGFKEGDDINTINKMIKKIVNLRIFKDEAGKMNLNINTL